MSDDEKPVLAAVQSRLRHAEQLLARRDAQLVAARGENTGLVEALEREIGMSREWQEIAVDLGAFARVEKRGNRTILYGSIEIDAGLIAAAGPESAAIIAAIVKDKMLRPMIMEAEKKRDPKTIPETSLHEKGAERAPVNPAVQ